MPGNKITEKEIGSALSDSTNLVITQPETPSGGGDPVESLRRKNITDLVNYLVNKGIVDSSALTRALSGLVDSVVPSDEGGSIIIHYKDGHEDEIPVGSGDAGISEEERANIISDISVNEDGDKYIITKLNGDEDELTPIGGSGGGSTTGSRMTFACYTAGTFSVMDTSGQAIIRYKFTSVDTETGMTTGNGTLSIYVDGVLRQNMTVAQGDNLQVNVFNLLASGSNAVRLVMTDSYGLASNRSFTITKESFYVEWNLADTITNTDDLQLTITPSGSGSKQIVIILDGVEYQRTTISSSGRRMSLSIPLTVGAHNLEVYGIMTSSGLESNHLYCAIAETSSISSEVVVAASWPDDVVTQYDNITIPHRVIDPSNNPATVYYYIDGALYNTVSLDRSEHVFSYRPSTAGSLTIGIRCGSVTWQKTVTVRPLSSEIDEITDSLTLKVDPNSLVNLNSFTLSSHFDELNGGLQNDDNNIRCIKVLQGDRLTIPVKPFQSDVTRTGTDIKVIYKIVNSSDMNAEAITCSYSDVGFKVMSNSAVLSSNVTSLRLPSCEGQKIELDFNIEKLTASNNSLMSIWVDGKLSRVTPYGSGSFTHLDPAYIVVGSDNCDVYLYGVRVYSRDLTKNEILTNFIADGEDAVTISNRYDRNQIYDSTGHYDISQIEQICQSAHVITIRAPHMTQAKDDVVSSIIRHSYLAGGSRHSWIARCKHKAQGTTSLNYRVAGCNVDFDAKENGFELEDGSTISKYAMTDDSIPVSYFNIKTNVASMEHTNNMCMAEWYQRFQPYVRPKRQADPRVRDTVEGHMAVIFYTNTSGDNVEMGPYTVGDGETVLYGLGNMNNSKKSTEAFAYDDIVIEVSNNTSDQCRGKSDDLTTETWDGDGNFEFRYLNENVYTEAEAKAIFQQFLTWLVSCDYTHPTNTRLPQEFIDPDTGDSYTMDTALYRIAKFKAEAADWMVMDSILYHKIFTNIFSCRDNRAKNMFWSYDHEVGKWTLVFAYDMDTVWGTNNSGVIDIGYGYMDTDTLGSGDVFNAADSTVFQMVDQCFWDEQVEMYKDLENAGCFNMEAYRDWCDEIQAGIPEALWNDDAYRKAVDVYKNKGDSQYLTMVNGTKALQQRNFAKFQQPFMAGYYEGPSMNTNTVYIRAYTPNTWTAVRPEPKITVTMYSDIWLNWRSGSFPGKRRVYAGVPTEIEFETQVNNDTENYIRFGHLVQDLGDLSCLYPSTVDVACCSKLKRLQIGSSEAGYDNSNFKNLSIDNAATLEYLNIEGCSKFGDPTVEGSNGDITLTNNLHLKEVYTRGTQATSIRFADNCRVETALLNAMKSLYAHGLYLLETFSMANYESLTSINIVESPSIPSLNILKQALNIQRVRLIDIDWDTDRDAYDPLINAYNALGIDDDGFDVSHGVVTGAVHFDAIGNTRFNDLKNKLTSVEFTRDTTMAEITATFKSWDGSQVLGVVVTEVGTTIPEPVASGLFATPTRPSDDDYNYTWFGWDKSLINVQESFVTLPTFATSTRYNTVRYIDSKNNAVLEEYTIIAGGTCYYHGSDLTNGSAVWIGWDKDAINVREDMDIYSVYITPTLPTEIKDVTQFDYVYSDDPEDTSAYTFGELYSIIKLNRCAEYGITAGKEIKMIPYIALQNNVINANDTSIVFQYVSTGHRELAAGGMSHADFLMKGLLRNTRRMHYSNTNVGGWPTTEMRTWLQETLFPVLDPKWRALIASSVSISTEGNQSSTTVTCNDKLWLPSAAEIGVQSGSPYTSEVHQDANEVAFPVFTDAASRIKRVDNGTGASAQNYWTRSPYAGNDTGFVNVITYGTAKTNSATNSTGVCVGFSA